MADQKDKAQEKKRQEETAHTQDDDHGISGGNAGAGKSGKEGMGKEEPNDEAKMDDQ